MRRFSKSSSLGNGSTLFQVVRGVTYNKADVRDQPGENLIPVLRANNIQDGQLILKDLVYVPRKYVSAQQMLQPGDILIASSSGSRDIVGKAAMADLSHTNFAFGAFCSVARSNTENDARWLAYFTQSTAYREYVERVALGIHINNFRTSDLAELPIPICSPLAQPNILAKLDGLFGRTKTARDELDQIPRLVERYRQAVLACAFRGELTADWRGPVARRGEAFERGQSWEAKSLIDLCDQKRGITYGVIKLGEEVSGGTPCLRTSNVRWLRIETEGMKRISPALSKDYARTILRGGEVLVNVRGTLGGVAVVGSEMAGWNVSREVAVVPVNTAQFDSAYVAYWVGANASQRWLSGVEKGVAYTGINLEDLRKLPIDVPPIEEQREIVRRVGEAFARIAVFAGEGFRASELLQRLNQSILTKAYRGELVSSDAHGRPLQKEAAE